MSQLYHADWLARVISSTTITLWFDLSAVSICPETTNLYWRDVLALLSAPIRVPRAPGAAIVRGSTDNIIPAVCHSVKPGAVTNRVWRHQFPSTAQGRQWAARALRRRQEQRRPARAPGCHAAWGQRSRTGRRGVRDGRDGGPHPTDIRSTTP